MNPGAPREFRRACRTSFRLFLLSAVTLACSCQGHGGVKPVYVELPDPAPASAGPQAAVLEPAATEPVAAQDDYVNCKRRRDDIFDYCTKAASPSVEAGVDPGRVSSLKSACLQQYSYDQLQCSRSESEEM